MKVIRNGIILNTEKYHECVSFYKETFDLKVMFQQNDGESSLTCFEFGGAYLMIETGGVAKSEGKSMAENSTKLRFNVANIDDALERMLFCGIKAVIQRNSWGSTINIYDPDGNRIGIRDEPTFESQITRS